MVFAQWAGLLPPGKRRISAAIGRNPPFYKAVWVAGRLDRRQPFL